MAQRAIARALRQTPANRTTHTNAGRLIATDYDYLSPLGQYMEVTVDWWAADEGDGMWYVAVDHPEDIYLFADTSSPCLDHAVYVACAGVGIYLP